MTKIASPQAADAYKTYLYRKGHRTVSQIESIKPGQMIDLSVLESDIEHTEKIISMCEKVDLPSYEEQYKIKGLKALHEQVSGRMWPSFADIKQEIEAAQANGDFAEAAKKLELQKLQLAWSKAQLNQQTTSNFLPDPKPGKKGLSTGVYKYPIQMLPKLKANPAPKTTEMGLGRSQIEQEWIMRVGVASNCNISIVQTNTYATNAELRCKVCGSVKTVATNLIVRVTVLTDDLERFCREHRHNQVALAGGPTGRKFRDD